jgi:predicted secreted protein
MVAAQCVVLALLLAGPPPAARADADTHYNRIQLQAQQTESVSNDVMHVTLSTFGEARDPAELATRVNDDMQWALGVAKRYAGVTVGTGSYQTYPVYEENELKRWRAQQNLELEGKDSRRVGQLVGELQARLQVKSMSFSVSNEKRITVENRLIGQALEAFKTRAGIIGNNLHSTGYRIVDLSIGTSSPRPPVPYPVGVRAASMTAAESRPGVQAGESEIAVTVSGTIELTMP